jgi:ribosomal protein S18 acetylase RimI-like enzyme
MDVRIVSMGRQNLDACGRILDGLPVFRRYGIYGDTASKLLGAALDEGRPDLRVALDGAGAALGLAWLVPRGAFDRSSYLRLIAVTKTHQRSGVGRRLVAALEDTHLGRGGIFVLVSTEDPVAQGFWQGLGYGEVGVLPNYSRAGWDELIYFKPPR